MSWHDISQRTTLPHLTSPHNTNHITSSNHMTPLATSPHIASPPLKHHGNTNSHQQNATTRLNGWRLVHKTNSVWASDWLVSLRTFYREILSLVYSFFSPWNFGPRLAREPLVLWSDELSTKCCQATGHSKGVVAAICSGVAVLEAGSTLKVLKRVPGGPETNVKMIGMSMYMSVSPE